MMYRSKKLSGLILIGLVVLVLGLTMQNRIQAAFLFQSPLPEPSTPCISQTSSGFTLEVFGYVDNGDGTTTITYRVTNTNKKDISYIGFGLGSWSAVAPADGSTYSGGLGDYNVEWTNSNGNPGFPSIKYETDFDGFSQGAQDTIALTVSNFDSNASIQVQMKAGKDKTTFTLALNDPVCDKTPVPTPTPTPESPLPAPTPTPMPTVAADVFTTGINYIAQEHNLPIDMLHAAAPYYATFPNLGLEYINLAVVDRRGGGRIYRLLVDPVTLSVEPDVGAVKRAEEEAYIAQFGKVDAALHERLQTAGASEEISISIWVNGSGNGQPSLYEQVAAHFPEAQAALSQGRKPWDVDNAVLAQQIRAKYRQIIKDNNSQRLAPVADYIQQQYSISVSPNSSIPSISVILTKVQIEDLVQHPQVAMLHLAEGEDVEEQASSSNGVDGARIGATGPWNNGINGSGIEVAVLERHQIDDRTTVITVTNRYSVTNNYGSIGHKTRVASMLASSDPNYPGMADGVTLIDANYGASSEISTTHKVVDTLQWVTTLTPDIHLVNASFGIKTNITSTVQWLDRAVDYWSRHEDVLLIKSAGNEGLGSQDITSPGKAWNVIAVGAVDINTNKMRSTSSWRNPVSATGAATDREKPELVAPGGPFITYSINNTALITDPRAGTSFAAPQVTGLAAMISQVENRLESQPEAMRAVLLASSNTNIEGVLGIPRDGIQMPGDLKDGAGQIDATRAVKIAQTYIPTATVQCTDACWWYKTTANPEPDIERFFVGQKDQRARVAIAWWSNADNDTNDYSFDRLDTNFDLRVEYQDASGNWIMVPLGSSQSDDNNYELLDIRLPVSGDYRIVVQQTAVYNGESSNVVGIALTLVKDLYLPLINSNIE